MQVSCQRQDSHYQKENMSFSKCKSCIFMKNFHFKYPTWVHKVNKYFWLEADNRYIQTIRKGQNILCKSDVFSMNSLQFLYKQVIRRFFSKANVISRKTSQIHLLPNEVHAFFSLELSQVVYQLSIKAIIIMMLMPFVVGSLKILSHFSSGCPWSRKI